MWCNQPNCAGIVDVLFSEQELSLPEEKMAQTVILLSIYGRTSAGQSSLMSIICCWLGWLMCFKQCL